MQVPKRANAVATYSDASRKGDSVEANGSPNRTLVRIEVQDLLERFNHSLDFDEQWEFLIIHGPNGVGKTRLLELINYVFTGQYLQLTRVPFRSIRFEFDDESWVEVSRDIDSAEQLFDDTTPVADDDDDRGTLHWQALLPDKQLVSYPFRPKLDPAVLRQFDRMTHDWPIARIGPQRWIDHSTGEELGPLDLAERFDIPFSSAEQMRDEEPKIYDLLDPHRVHLIQAQRLLRPARYSRRRDIYSDTRTQVETVVSYADDLSQQLKAALAENSRRSQDLDRSFPSRLFEQSDTVSTSEEEMRSHYDEQLLLRSRLAEIDILDKSPELPLPDRDLDDWELRALSTYLDDTDEKLQTFQELLNKLELMRNIVDSRFLFKTLEIGQDFGFAFRDEDSHKKISPRELSSGEQHQLVLTYDLLMNVDEYSLVLIDEPEISLHIDWQNVFLDDLSKIARLSKLRFIIATHSPQIIGNWWNQTARLYDTSSNQ